jgi:hypothetical protein
MSSQSNFSGQSSTVNNIYHATNNINIYNTLQNNVPTKNMQK